MKKKDLGKLYDRFTGEERFRLYIEALYRGDESEAERLIESCPRDTYSVRELAYTKRCAVSNSLTTGVCMELLQHLVKLEMIEAFRNILPCIFKICINEA